MNIQEVGTDLLQQMTLLKNKFDSEGQHLSCRLDGLMNTKDLKYWDYVSLDVLLNLQQPRTDFPDEMVFIGYHQITELYFKLIIWEMDQLTRPGPVSDVRYLDKINRIIRYYEQLVASFDIVADGMEYEQFHKFRTALFPASGFQSVQYRFIELGATDLRNLVALKYRDTVPDHESVDQLYKKLYWKEGAVEVVSGRKDLSLIHFESKYDELCQAKARKAADHNLWRLFTRHLQHSPLLDRLTDAMRRLDWLANVQWSLAHYRAAAKHLQRRAEVLPATGGTNWQKYLSPRFQKVMFFPDLWSEEEKQNWGKSAL